MKHGSLFSGIGGFDLAAEWMGWENIFHCEWNPFGQKVLKHYWPNAISYTDITKTDFSIHRGEIDILTGGFPCQPFSAAGKRKGVEDNRYLWPEMLRTIKEIQPAWIVAENVHGIINQGRGMVFEQVQIEMENEGYEVTPFIIPACAKDAVHRRDRVWIVAYTETTKRKSSGNTWAGRAGFTNGNINAANTINQGLQRNEQRKTFEQRTGSSRPIAEPFENENWIEAATRLCSVDDELAGRLDTDTISKSKWRVESLKAYGNAIYWPVAYEIFKAIEQIN